MPLQPIIKTNDLTIKTEVLDDDYIIGVDLTEPDEEKATFKTKIINVRGKDVVSLNTIADMKLREGSYDGQGAQLNGFTTPGDGGGGDFSWNASYIHLATDKDGMIVYVTGVTVGAWIRNYTGAINVRWTGAKGDGVTVDTEAIQNAIDFDPNTRYAVYLPQGDYVVDKPIELGRKSLFSDAQIRQCAIRTNGSFDTTNGYQIIRNWKTEDYAPGETGVARKLPPADLTGVDINRYVTMSNFFVICSDAELTNVYLVAQQETSGIRNININVGISPNNADYGIILESTQTGTAISQNGVILRDIVYYGENCKSCLIVDGRGNDVHLDTINIGSIQCTENPIVIDTIDVTITNLHCEAVAPDGDYIINLPGGSDGLSITKSIFFLSNLGSGGVSGMAGVIDYDPLNKTGFGRSTPTMRDITFTPVDSGETSNLGSMYILNDQALGDLYRLKYTSWGSGALITKLHELTTKRLIADNSNEVIDISAYGSNLKFRSGDNTLLVTGSNVPLHPKFKDTGTRYYMVFQVMGRNEGNGNPAVIEGTVAVGRNSSNVFKQSVQIDKTLNVPSGVSLTYNGTSEQFELTTTSATSMICLGFNFTGLIDFNEID